MSNYTTKITQTSIKINGKLHFSKMRNGEISLHFEHGFKCQNEYVSDRNI